MRKTIARRITIRVGRANMTIPRNMNKINKSASSQGLISNFEIQND